MYRRRFIMALGGLVLIGGCFSRLVITRGDVVGRYVLTYIDAAKGWNGDRSKFVQLNADGSIEPGSSVLCWGDWTSVANRGTWTREKVWVVVDLPGFPSDLQRCYFYVTRRYLVMGPIELSPDPETDPRWIVFSKE